jgi:hypothetical protein
VPYARERYFENHKMMSAVDKLHKLYASTAAPVVWAHSTGVEALNEPDGLKAGIIGAVAGDSEWSALVVARASSGGRLLVELKCLLAERRWRGCGE